MAIAFVLALRVFAHADPPDGMARDDVTPEIICAKDDDGHFSFLKSYPRHVGDSLKKQIRARDGCSSAKDCEVDHCIPRELGGADDIGNLWAEPYPEAHQKDKVENAARDQFCGDKSMQTAYRLKLLQDAVCHRWRKLADLWGIE